MANSPDYANNRLTQLTGLGQSIWYDFIERKLIVSGELKRLIEEDELRGVTSNPAIFGKAISSSDLYADQLRKLAEQGKSPLEIYENLAVTDVQNAADVLRPVYDRTAGADGFVSLECSPKLANDTQATIVETRRLWNWVNRPNLMVKIPGTPEGMPAIEQTIYEGININITLLFSLEAYEQTMEAYLRGLERRAAEGKPIDRIASVASFFVSRIDTAVDKRLEALITQTADEGEKNRLRELVGRIATANAKMAYQRFKTVFGSERFAALKSKGARLQRPLWASTSTKNPSYSDVYYVEALIGPDTVDTLPPATLVAFRDHGTPRVTIEEALDQERERLDGLERAGISLDEVTTQVLADGVRLFVEPFEALLATITSRSEEILGRSASSTGND
ncbi:MAG TPA: transaldolase [Blastocatellia bacterium]|nr:transaldolase [Blastocatellia bacterium]